MKNGRRFLALVVLLAVAPMSALAHPGHGSSDSGSDAAAVTHYLTEPQHAAVAGAIILCLGVIAATRFALTRRSYS